MSIEHNSPPEMRQASHHLLHHDIREGREKRNEYVEQLIRAYTDSQYDHLAQIAGMSVASFTALLLPEHPLRAFAAIATALYLVALFSRTILIPRKVRLGLLGGVWVLIMSALGAIAGAAFVAVSTSIWYLVLIYKDAIEVRRIKRIQKEDSSQLTLGELEHMHTLAKPEPMLMDVLEAWNRQQIALTRFEYLLFVQTIAAAQREQDTPCRLAV